MSAWAVSLSNAGSGMGLTSRRVQGVPSQGVAPCPPPAALVTQRRPIAFGALPPSFRQRYRSTLSVATPRGSCG